MVPVKDFSGRPGHDPRAGEAVNLTIFLPLTTTDVQKPSATPLPSLNRERHKVELVDRVTPIITEFL